MSDGQREMMWMLNDNPAVGEEWARLAAVDPDGTVYVSGSNIEHKLAFLAVREGSTFLTSSDEHHYFPIRWLMTVAQDPATVEPGCAWRTGRSGRPHGRRGTGNRGTTRRQMRKPRYKPLKTLASEREVQRAVVAAFVLYGVEAERRNVGACKNPNGQLVTFGRPGDSDLTGIFPAHFGPAAGKRFDLEVKKEGFDPSRCYGAARRRFDAQLARLRRINECGGYGWWTSDPADVVQFLGRIREGWIVRIADDDIPEVVEVAR